MRINQRTEGYTWVGNRTTNLQYCYFVRENGFHHYNISKINIILTIMRVLSFLSGEK